MERRVKSYYSPGWVGVIEAIIAQVKEEGTLQNFVNGNNGGVTWQQRCNGGGLGTRRILAGEACPTWGRNNGFVRGRKDKHEQRKEIRKTAASLGKQSGAPGAGPR